MCINNTLGCSHYCELDQNDAVFCSCPPGYTLAADGATCTCKPSFIQYTPYTTFPFRLW